MNTTIDGDSLTPQKKKNGREENKQKGRENLFDKNEANKSIIVSKTIALNVSKTIVPNVSEKIKQIANNKIEQIVSKQNEIEINKNVYNPHCKAFLDNNPIPSLTTPIGKSFRIYTENRTDPTIQPTIDHLKQATRPGHSDRNQFSTRSLNSGIIFPYRRGILITAMR